MRGESRIMSHLQVTSRYRRMLDQASGQEAGGQDKVFVTFSKWRRKKRGK